MKKKLVAGTLVALACANVSAEEVGTGKTNDPDATPPETTTVESCASTLECAWQELLDIFEMDTE